MNSRTFAFLAAMSAIPTLGLTSCTADTLLNQTASLGGDIPGQRGNISIEFVNNTPFKAVFMGGSYVPENQGAMPDFQLFSIEQDTDVDGNAISPPVLTRCGRVYELGGPRLIQLVVDSQQDVPMDVQQTGVSFFSIDSENPDAEPVLEGTAEPITTLLGAQFECESLLIYRFEIDETRPGGFRIDFEVVLP